MPNNVYTNPAELRRFADDLTRTLNEYQQSMRHLDSHLCRLARTWRDDEFELFYREVKATQVMIQGFIEEGRAARRELLIDAERAEAYQQVRDV